MNSINIISTRVPSTSSPVSSRSNSLSAISLAAPTQQTSDPISEGGTLVARNLDPEPTPDVENPDLIPQPDLEPSVSEKLGRSAAEKEDLKAPGEETPLLPRMDEKPYDVPSSIRYGIPRRIATTFLASLRLVLSALATPGVYIWACFCDENGVFAPGTQLRRFFGFGRKFKVPKLALQACDTSDEHRDWSSTATTPSGLKPGTSHFSASESAAESFAAKKRDGSSRASGRRHSRSKSAQELDEISPSRRSTRIKLQAGHSLRNRKHLRTGRANSKARSEGVAPQDISAQLKSPTSPMAALTKYPKTPAPPRPLIPRRQPSYINYEPPSRECQKTLILDLDETLIHSMSKGGRIGTGHMVEVRLTTSYAGAGGQMAVGPQHPILYFVHKRPHCDEFLRRVYKWYNLVIFTASVQEYADPVIDWLESERKFFSKRYYRQHCTFRHGAFIKDLSSVEPDLSRVMILDNSPLSYMFHQGMYNATALSRISLVFFFTVKKFIFIFFLFCFVLFCFDPSNNQFVQTTRSRSRAGLMTRPTMTYSTWFHSWKASSTFQTYGRCLLSGEARMVDT